MSTENVFVSGARCCWFGHITEAAASGTKCPHCLQPLMEWSSEAAYWKNVGAFERGEYDVDDDEKPKPHPGYIEMVKWGLGQMRDRRECYKNIVHLKNSYKKHVGIDVDVSRGR
jgi:hypothetical protein